MPGEPKYETTRVNNALMNTKRYLGGAHKSCDTTQRACLTHLKGDIEAAEDRVQAHALLLAFVNRTENYTARVILPSTIETKLTEHETTLRQALEAAGKVYALWGGRSMHFWG